MWLYASRQQGADHPAVEVYTRQIHLRGCFGSEMYSPACFIASAYITLSQSLSMLE